MPTMSAAHKRFPKQTEPSSDKAVKIILICHLMYDVCLHAMR